MKKLFTALLICLVGATFTPICSAGPRPRWFSAKPIKLKTVSPTLKKSTSKLASTPVHGYVQMLSKKTGRDVLVEKGALGMNMHQAVGLHEFFFPEKAGKLLPPEFNSIIGIEKKTPDYIEDTYLRWKQLSGRSRLFLLESALPAYLAEPQGEEIFIPSASQLEEALAFYREVLGAGGNSKLPYSGQFGGAMSAVCNLSLLGSKQDAPLILYAAKKDFTSANKFVDYFVTRALIALNAKEELKELAAYRVENLKENEQLPAVWRGVNETYKLNMDDDLIAKDSETMPDFMQKDLLLHHPFNYLLLNPSEQVGQDWRNVRQGIHEQFKMALAQEPAGRDIIGQGAVQEEPFTFEPPKPKTISLPVAPAKKEGISTYTLLAETDKLLKNALREDRINQAAIQKSIRESLAKEKASAAPSDKEITLPPSYVLRAEATQTKAELRAELEDYIATHHHLPPAKSTLYKKIYVVSNSHLTDPDSRAIKQIYNENRAYKSIMPEEVLQELKTYLSEHNDQLPPVNSRLRVRVHEMIRRNPKDPYAQEIKALWEAHKASAKGPGNTPANIRKLVEEYLATHNNEFPPAGTALRASIHRIFANGDPDDPDVQALRALHSQYKEEKQKNTPAKLRARLEEYLAQHPNTLPPSGTSFRSLLYATVKRGDPNDPDVHKP